MNNAEVVSVRISPKMLKMIDKVVSNGKWLNRADFLRGCAYEKLLKLGVAKGGK
jgi:Arc/MetJ-type ribon-helix-helix transcriptional regulator